QASSWVSARAGGPLWPAAWPLPAQLGLALLLGELPMYWYHRFVHANSLAWRLHATHHSAPRLYWLNGLRGHPLDLVLGLAAYQLPLAFLGAGEPVLVLVAGFVGIHGLLQHSNVHHRVGPLNWIVSSAELHRWHHSRVLAEANNNFGHHLVVWDVV